MKKSQVDLFLELADPDENGFSRVVYTTEFGGKYKILNHTNGCSWGRSDGGLGKKYNIVRNKQGIRVISYQLNGYNTSNYQTNIPSSARKAHKNSPCVVLGITGNSIEIDHKNGRKNSMHKLGIKDFQPLSKGPNDAKRQHCANCRATGNRFDAKLLGYAISFTKGGLVYDGSPTGCEGCYWYDPKQFNLLASCREKKSE